MNKKSEIRDLTIKEKLEDTIKLIVKKTNIKFTTLGYIFAVFGVFFIFGIFEKLLSDIIAIIYPLYWSILSLYTKDSDNIRQWIVYWNIYAFIILVDKFDFLITQQVPFYFLIKSLFLLWLYSPNFRGSILLYNYFYKSILKVLYIEHENYLKKEIEHLIN